MELMKHTKRMTYKPKLEEIEAGRVTQTIRKCRSAGLIISVAKCPNYHDIPTRYIYRTDHIYTAIEKLYDEFQSQLRCIHEGLRFELKLDLYEKRLIEEWDLVYNQMLDELGEDDIEDAVNILKDVIYAWIINHSDLGEATDDIISNSELLAYIQQLIEGKWECMRDEAIENMRMPQM